MIASTILFNRAGLPRPRSKSGISDKGRNYVVTLQQTAGNYQVQQGEVQKKMSIPLTIAK